MKIPKLFKKAAAFVKPGVQYVQLRYLPGKLDAHHR